MKAAADSQQEVGRLGREQFKGDSVIKCAGVDLTYEAGDVRTNLPSVILI
jgi:hypothetical protein